MSAEDPDMRAKIDSSCPRLHKMKSANALPLLIMLDIIAKRNEVSVAIPGRINSLQAAMFIPKST
jgi:hypothetical protein